MKLLGFEFKKLCAYKYVFVIAALLLVINGALCVLTTEQTKRKLPDPDVMSHAYTDYLEDPKAFLAYREELAAYQEEQDQLIFESMLNGTEYIKPEKYWKYTETVDYSQELKVINTVLEAAENAKNYQKDIENFITENKLKLAAYDIQHENEKNSFIRRYTVYTIQRYEALQTKDIGIGFEYLRGWEEYFTFDAGNILAFLAVLVCACAVMLGDKSCGFYLLLSASKKGRAPTLRAKLWLSSLSAVCISLVFSLSTFAIFAVRLGLSSPLNVIQAFSTFRFLPFKCSVISYFFLFLFMKVFVCVLLALISTALATLINHYVYAYLAGVGVIGLNLALFLFNALNPNGFFKVNNLFSAASVNPLFVRVRTFAFFEFPLENLILFPLILLLLAVLCISLTFLFYHRTGLTGKHSIFKAVARLFQRPRRKRVRRKSRHSSTLLSYEFYKLVGSPMVLLLVLLTLGGSLYTAYMAFREPPNLYGKIYSEYMDVLAGPETKESLEYIAEERRRLSDILAKKEEIRNLFAEKKISPDEYSDYMTEYYTAEVKERVFSTVESHRDYIMQYRTRFDKEVFYIHDWGYNLYFSRSMDLWFYALLLILTAGIFSMEYKSTEKGGSFYAVLQTTKNGRKKTFGTKLLAAVLLYFPLFILFTGGELFLFIHFCGLPESNAPLASIEQFKNLSFPITIMQCLILEVLARCLGGLLLVLITAAFSQFAKKPIPTLTFTMLLTLLPHVLVLLGIKQLELIDFSSLMCAHTLIRASADAVPKLLCGMFVFVLFILIAILLTASLAVGSYCSFTKTSLGRSVLRHSHPSHKNSEKIP